MTDNVFRLFVVGIVLPLSICIAAGDAWGQAATALESFEAGIPPNLTMNHVAAEVIPGADGNALKVRFEKADWPNVFITPPQGVWDWSAYAGLALDVRNPETESIEVCIRIDNAGADGVNHCNTARTSVPPGETVAFRAYFAASDTEPFWGMRGVPIRGPLSQGPAIDPSKITAFQVFLPLPDKPHTLILDNIRLFGQGGPLDKLVPMPFIDRFGQYKHAEWPGKLKTEDEWPARIREEEAAIDAAPELPGRDRFGGWREGPQLEATGWFRTEKVDGRWWLVTPDGNLFFSTGMDCVGTWEQTFIEGRQDWFEWLPEPDGPYKDLFAYQGAVHSMAEKIGGKGRTINWYGANLYRKYGDNWRVLWRDNALRRLRAWGFNTIGNWSQDDVIGLHAMPFTATCSTGGGVPEVQGGAGYWGKMKDVFDDSFAPAVDAAVSAIARKHAADPMCIGYFVDNELSWGTLGGHDIAVWTLASPAHQPCRWELIDRLKAKHGSLEALNAAWGTDAKDWDTLRAPGTPNTACAADLDEFVYAFARKYFDTVKSALRKHAPNQLYLGCRFSTASRAAVKACADVADVVSFNLYQRAIDGAQWTGAKGLGKPILIGEFHFGALDRGMFHPGLVPTRNQADRAESYVRYMRSVADCPAFVGCHWFQYADEPTTGRYFDGENYNIGFVTVTDTPYPEMVAAARRAHGDIYRRHLNAGPIQP